jgi:riboflavin biosynthesis pyrimidine reductase
MLLQRAVPPGDPVTPPDAYGDLGLDDLAPADRPHVVVNFVSSADGKATLAGRSGGLGGPADRAAFHLLRSQVDAILAGTGTLRAENYGRLVRDPQLEARRRAQGRRAQPLAVVVSRSGEVPWEIPLLSDPASRAVVFAPAGTEMPATGAQLTRAPLGDPDDLRAMLTVLRAQHGVRSLLCEGGPRLFGALLAAERVDELFLTLAPTLAGGGELPVSTGHGPAEPLELHLVSALSADGTLLLRYRRR